MKSIRRRSRFCELVPSRSVGSCIVGDPLHNIDGAELFGAILQYPASSGRSTRSASGDQPAFPREGRARHCGCRPTGVSFARIAARARCRYCNWFGAASWRADGLWRPSCGLYRCARRAQACSSWTHRGPKRGTHEERLPTAWRYKPASNTSVARRLLRTSVRREFPLPLLPQCTPSITVPKDSFRLHGQ